MGMTNDGWLRDTYTHCESSIVILASVLEVKFRVIWEPFRNEWCHVTMENLFKWTVINWRKFHQIWLNSSRHTIGFGSLTRVTFSQHNTLLVLKWHRRRASTTFAYQSTKVLILIQAIYTTRSLIMILLF